MREVFAILVISLLFCAPCNAMEKDKRLHFGVSAVFGLGTGMIAATQTDGTLKDYAVAATVATLPGLWKECMDDGTQGNKFDWQDLKYDALGAFSAVGSVALGVNGYHLMFGRNSVVLKGEW